LREVRRRKLHFGISRNVFVTTTGLRNDKKKFAYGPVALLWVKEVFEGKKRKGTSWGGKTSRAARDTLVILQ